MWACAGDGAWGRPGVPHPRFPSPASWERGGAVCAGAPRSGRSRAVPFVLSACNPGGGREEWYFLRMEETQKGMQMQERSGEPVVETVLRFVVGCLTLIYGVLLAQRLPNPDLFSDYIAVCCWWQRFPAQSRMANQRV